MRRLCIIAALLAGLLWPSAANDASAQIVLLQISTQNLTFASADPDTTPTLSALPLTLTYTVFLSGGAEWRITVQASDDLRNGSSTIPVSSMTWTAFPAPPFRAGTLSRLAAQTMASGRGDVFLQATCTATFSLPNSWTYAVVTYTTSLVFTLSCP
jgi:hypothetical protein